MKKNRIFILTGLAISLGIATLLSPFASQNPDGLDRVAQDLEFDDKAIEEPLTQKLPPAKVFTEYSVNAVSNEKVSTAVAGLTGTLVVFGLAWGMGKMVVKKTKPEE
ncbi:PDGLE domain-containing protein [Pseudanabaena mucicola]|uniref:PDGLE domain-containing protein n=1 Tax=Pseudanabaena mucicola FACHB-723 TaxID=2692860 RepID=A0ABR7ZX87_9CYAN|nr:PDGLE domain-containing protein [Pseudanabaena mucicola]MBD2188008.1 PDGLE domain-containing protein [Pseudanabaena mucicola FACHB-723]